MTDLPWVKFPTSLAGHHAMQILSLEELGAFTRLSTIAINIGDGGRLSINGEPMSIAMIFRTLGIAETKGDEIITSITSTGLIKRDEAGAVLVPWVEKALSEAVAYSETQSQKAHQRWEKSGNHATGNATGDAAAMPGQCHKTRPDKRRKDKSSSTRARAGDAAAGRDAGEEPDTPPSPPPTDRTPPPPTPPPAEPPPQRHDDADTDAAGQAELSPVVTALMEVGIELSKAEKLAGYEWVTLEVVKKRRRELREGQRPGLLITQLEQDERQIWKSKQDKRDEAERVKAAEETRRRDAEEALAAKAHQQAGEDDELLAEATADELAWAAKHPSSHTRAALRDGPKDAAKLPVDRILRHQLAEGVRCKRGLERIKATMKPPTPPPPATTLKLAG